MYQRVDNEEKIRMGQTLSESLMKKSNQTAALPSTPVLALSAPDADQTSCNQLTLHLPSTESSANVLQSQPTCIVQNVNENNPMDVT